MSTPRPLTVEESEMLDALEALDYSGTLGDVLGRMPDWLIKSIVTLAEEFEVGGPVLAYLATCLKCHAEGNALETHTDLNLLGELMNRSRMAIHLEQMRRDGCLEIDWPPTILTEGLRMKKTAKGELRHAELSARMRAEQAGNSSG